MSYADEEDNNSRNFKNVEIEYESTCKIRELDITKLPPLDSKDVKNGFRVMFIGKPGSGKSKAIESYLYFKKHIIPVAQVASGTEAQNKFYSNFLPEPFIFNDIDPDNLTPIENFGKRQEYAVEYLEKRKGINPWAVQIIDDCTADPKFLKKKYFQKVAKYGRHWRIAHVISFQYIMNAFSEIRSTIDGVFIFNEKAPDNRKKLWQTFGGCVRTQKEFDDIMEQLTDDHSCIYIDLKSQSNNMEDCIFYYKADISRIPSKWRFGCDEMWEFAEERYIGNANMNTVVF